MIFLWWIEKIEKNLWFKKLFFGAEGEESNEKLWKGGKLVQTFEYTLLYQIQAQNIKTPLISGEKRRVLE